MKLRHTVLLAVLITTTASCRDVAPPSGWTVDEKPEVAAAEPTANDQVGGSVEQTDGMPATDPPVRPRSEPFVVHEWGTFTSLQGSDGRDQTGMHHEDESLPAFVYGRVPAQPNAPKQVEAEFVAGVTQKLETPVIYFYGAPEHVDVRVDFPGGVVSQWYPNASSFEPPLHSTSFESSAFPGGSMTWSLDVLPVGTEAGIIDVPADDIWAPSRNVAAQPVRVGDEVEKFVFYRGLGRFETPFRVTSRGDQLTVHNDSAQPIEDVWILQFDGTTGSVWPLGALEADSNRVFSPTPKELPLPDYLDRARETIAEGLVRSGLTNDESWAMVDTWNRSYFHTPGLRVLYVVPEQWTNDLLPLSVDPKPDEVVRTLVGRVEVMTQAEEQRLLTAVTEGSMVLDDLGRFAEPRLRRLSELADNPDAVRRLQSLLEATRSPN